ncbi:MAG: anti-sigma factor [Phycisphaerae bacterium]
MCQQASELIPLYVAGGLSDNEARQLQSHLATGCPGCNAMLTEFTTVGATLALMLPPAQPNPDVHASLMARIERHADNVEPRTPGQSRRWYAMGGLAAAIVLAVTLIAVSSYWHLVITQKNQQLVAMRDRLDAAKNSVNLLTAKYQAAVQTTALLQLQIKQSEMTRKMFMAKQLQVVALSGKPVDKRAVGRIFYNAKTHMWQFCAMGLKPLPPTKTYELWFITKDHTKKAAGTFNVDASGDGMLTAAVGQNMDKVSAVAVTDEPAGGVAVPTGSIQLIGTLQ